MSKECFIFFSKQDNFPEVAFSKCSVNNFSLRFYVIVSIEFGFPALIFWDKWMWVGTSKICFLKETFSGMILLEFKCQGFRNQTQQRIFSVFLVRHCSEYITCMECQNFHTSEKMLPLLPPPTREEVDVQRNVQTCHFLYMGY